MPHHHEVTDHINRGYRKYYGDLMAGPFDPQNYYNTLTQLYSSLFGRNWHLGYWLNASTFA